MTDIERQTNRLSLWAAILTALMAVVSLAMAVTTLPRSGPYCQSGCVGYPYTDAAAYVPRDYLWMYPAIVLTLLAMALMECIHFQMPQSRALLSRIGVAFTIMGVVILVVDYASQLTFIQPALLLGEAEGLSPWSQYNPHGIFIALENVGYVLFNLAFLFIGVAMVRMPTRLWRAAGWIFTIGGALTVALLVFFAAFYRVRLDYRFEVTAILITWLVLIVTPVLLSIAFRRRPIEAQQGAPSRDVEIMTSSSGTQRRGDRRSTVTAATTVESPVKTTRAGPLEAKATRAVISIFGILASRPSSTEFGQINQGSLRPAGLLIQSWPIELASIHQLQVDPERIR